MLPNNNQQERRSNYVPVSLTEHTDATQSEGQRIVQYSILHDDTLTPDASLKRVFHVSLASHASAADLRASHRSLEALCDAADSELKSIGQTGSFQVSRGNSVLPTPLLSAASSMNQLIAGQLSWTVVPSIASSVGIVATASRFETASTVSVPISHSAFVAAYQPAAFCMPVEFAKDAAMKSVICSPQFFVTSTAVAETPTMHPESTMDNNQVVDTNEEVITPSPQKNTRHICRYCGRACAKPSVLQKHIRTHTGERPYPCSTCGLDFKTKSNLYKHCKSRTHLYALSGRDPQSTAGSRTAPSFGSSGLIASESHPGVSDQSSDTFDAGAEFASAASGKTDVVSTALSVVGSPLLDVTSSSPHLSPVARLVTMPDGSMFLVKPVSLPPPISAAELLSPGMVIESSATAPTAAVNTSPPVRTAVTKSLSFGGSSSSVSGPKIAPLDPSNATTEALQERIALLISQNNSIINAPMAEAPRPKRVLRQSSDVGSTYVKTSAIRPLLRTQSLTPSPNVPSPMLSVQTVSENNSVIPNPVSPPVKPATPPVVMRKLIARTLSEPSGLAAEHSAVTKQHFLTVPQPVGVATEGILLPGSTDSSDCLPDEQCSKVKIVLQLSDDVSRPSSPVTTPENCTTNLNNSGNGNVFSKAQLSYSLQPGLAKSSVIGTSAGVLTQSPFVLRPTSGLMPTLCVVKPVGQPATAASSMPLQYIQPSPLVASLPVQFVLVPTNGGGEPSAGVIMPSSPPVEGINSQQPPRRGRPKGSKNRPKLAASASEPKAATVTPAAEPSMPLSTSHIGSSASVDSSWNWKMKLKDQLLLRQSRSMERAQSCEQGGRASPKVEPTTGKHVEQPIVSINSLSATALETTIQSSVSVSVTKSCVLSSSASLNSASPPTVEITTSTLVPIFRSHSCDASVPPKKRRKTLTELGRGTAFGTRVEEASLATNVTLESLPDVFEPFVPTTSVHEVGVKLEHCSGRSLSEVATSSSEILGSSLPLTNCIIQLMYDTPPLVSIVQSADNSSNKPRARNIDTAQLVLLQLPSLVGSKIPGLVLENSVTKGFAKCSVEHLSQLQFSFSAEGHMMELEKTTRPIMFCPPPSDCGLPSAPFDGSCLTSHHAHDAPVILNGAGKSKNRVEQDDLRSFRVSISEGEQPTGTVLLLGHSFPSLGIGAEPTFTTVLGTRPTSSVSSDNVSSYANWDSTNRQQEQDDDQSVPAREFFTLYRTPRSTAAEDGSRYVFAPVAESKTGGVVTHSSYWKFRNETAKQLSADVVADDVVEEMAVDSTKTSIDLIEETVPACIEPEAEPTDGVLSMDITENETTKEAAGSFLNVTTSCDNLSVCPADNGASSNDAAMISTCDMQPSHGGPDKHVWIFPGGYRSTESYVYVRGRGRGRYVCATCGVRCKKPSVLRKHLRSHTDIRPHHCRICDVSFKTKGNLSKHINSKAHHSRSTEFGSSRDQSVSGNRPLKLKIANSTSTSSSRTRKNSSVEMEVDSGCELQPGSSCEVEPDSAPCGVTRTLSLETDRHPVGIQRLGSSVEKGYGSTESVASLCLSPGISTEKVPTADESKRCVVDIDTATSLLNMSKCGQSGSKNTVAAEERAAKSATISHNAVKAEKHDTPLSLRTHHETVKQCVAPSQHTLSSALAAGFATPSLLVYNASSNTLIQFPSPLHLIPPSSSPDDSVSKSDTASTSSEVYQTGSDRLPFSSSSSAMWMSSPKATDSGTEHSMITKRAVNGSKTVPRLSRLDAVDLTMTGAGIDDDDSFVTGINSKECPATNTLAAATDNSSSSSSSKPGLVHREIEPVPVGVCAAEAAQRVGSCYVCPVCHKMFSSAPQLAIHNNIHFLERSSRCTICRSMFSNRAALERHKRVAHRSSSSALAQDNQDSGAPADGSDPRPYKCNECDIAFRIPGHLAKHRRSKAHAVRVEGRSDITQTADLDGDEEEVEQVVESASSLVTISSNASSEDGVGRKSDESVMVPVTDIAADLDQERVEADSTSVSRSSVASPPCTGVSAGTKSPELMIAATEIDGSPSHKVHESEPDNTRPQPSTDITSVESSVQLFHHRCTICDKVLPNLNAFMAHVTSHIERRPFVCEHCDAGFTTSRLLEEHRKLHSLHSVQSATHFCGSCNCGSIDCQSSRIAPPCTMVTCASAVPTSDCHTQPAPGASLLPSCITDSVTSLQLAATSSVNAAVTLSPCIDFNEIGRPIETESSVSSETNFDLHSNIACVGHRYLLKVSSNPNQMSHEATVSTPSFSPTSVKATETSRSPGTSASDPPTGAVVPLSCQSDSQTLPHQWKATATVPVTANVGSTF